MIRNCFSIIGFLTALIFLQQSIAFFINNVDHLAGQSNIINQKDIDPSALYYMESDLALKAEKQMHQAMEIYGTR